MTEQPLVSIIIVSWNRRDDLLACLASLDRLSFARRETLVIDNGSDDGSLEAVQATHPSVRLYKAEVNTGTSVSRNAAARRAKGDFLWFLDSDCIVEDTDAIETFLHFHDREPRLGGIGGESMRDHEGGPVTAFRVMRLLGSALTQTEIVDAASPHREADGIPTCNLFLSRAVFEEVGGFDPLFFHYLEDLDLTWRIKQTNRRLLVGATPRVDHRVATVARGGDLFTPKRNRVFFAAKNFSVVEILLLPLHDILYLLAPARIKTLTRQARAGGSAQGSITGYDARRENRLLGLTKTLWRAVQVVLSLPASYFLALPHLPEMLAARRRPGGGLDLVDMNLFQEIRPTSSSPGPSSPSPEQSLNPRR